MSNFLPDPVLGSPLARVPLGSTRARIFLDRATESAGFNEPTQDYLVLRHSPTRLCFAVTDGVSASFMGDIAAQVLAIGLVDWLYESPDAVNEGDFRAALAEHLDTLAKKAREKVAAWPMPPSVSGILLEALEQQRGYGSEAMFVCGSVDIGPQRRLARFAWLGDAHLRLTLRNGRTDHVTGAKAHRWSTRLGARGDIGLKFCPAEEVTRVIAYSDGLLPEVHSVVKLSDSRLRPKLVTLAQSANSDDIALIDIAFAPRVMPGKLFAIFRKRAKE